MEVRVFRSIEAMECLFADWDALFLACGGGEVFCTAAWVIEAYRSYAQREPLLLAVYAAEHKLVGIFPFAVRSVAAKGLSFRALVHGASDRADYSAFLLSTDINERVCLSRAVRKLVDLQEDNLWQVYWMNNFRESDGRSVLFRELLLRETFGASVRGELTPAIDLNRPFEESKKTSNVRRRFRKLTETHEADVVIGASPDLALLDRLANLHSMAYSDAAFSSPAGRKFFSNLCQHPGFQGFVEISYIEVQGAIIAAHFGFRCSGRLFYYVPTFDEQYATFGPGQYLLWRMITHYRGAGYREFDFLRGAEDYKFQWMNSCTQNFGIRAVGIASPWWHKVLLRLAILRQAMQKR